MFTENNELLLVQNIKTNNESYFSKIQNKDIMGRTIKISKNIRNNKIIIDYTQEIYQDIYDKNCIYDSKILKFIVNILKDPNYGNGYMEFDEPYDDKKLLYDIHNKYNEKYYKNK